MRFCRGQMDRHQAIEHTSQTLKRRRLRGRWFSCLPCADAIGAPLPQPLPRARQRGVGLQTEESCSSFFLSSRRGRSGSKLPWWNGPFLATIQMPRKALLLPNRARWKRPSIIYIVTTPATTSRLNRASGVQPELSTGPRSFVSCLDLCNSAAILLEVFNECRLFSSEATFCASGACDYRLRVRDSCISTSGAKTHAGQCSASPHYWAQTPPDHDSPSALHVGPRTAVGTLASVAA